MIATNHWILTFVSENWIILTLVVGMLKVISKHTPWVWDDGIYTLLSGLLGQIRGKQPPVYSPKMQDRGEELK